MIKKTERLQKSLRAKNAWLDGVNAERYLELIGKYRNDDEEEEKNQLLKLAANTEPPEEEEQEKRQILITAQEQEEPAESES